MPQKANIFVGRTIISAESPERTRPLIWQHPAAAPAPRLQSAATSSHIGGATPSRPQRAQPAHTHQTQHPAQTPHQRAQPAHSCLKKEPHSYSYLDPKKSLEQHHLWLRKQLRLLARTGWASSGSGFLNTQQMTSAAWLEASLASLLLATLRPVSTFSLPFRARGLT